MVIIWNTFYFDFSVTIYDTQTGNQKALIRNRMLQAQLSPNGTYLIGWDNPSQSKFSFHIYLI